MRRSLLAVKKLAIFCHRWMGVAFCVLFLWWFVTGIFMMYWTYPQVAESDRLLRAPVLDAAQVKLSPTEAYAKLENERPPDAIRLLSFDQRPVYLFRVGRGSTMVYADDGELQDYFPPELNLRTAARWTGQPAASAKVESVEEPDQWTLEGGIRTERPLFKYSFPDGQQVYISENTGEVLQYTTTSSRLFAYLGAIPHWLYFTPLRVNGELWTRVVIWSSGIATIAALLGLVVGLWMYSPSGKYRHQGQPTRIPYTGQKRLHTILGLFFGILACTWAFSGMLSMDPFPFPAPGAGAGKGRALTPATRIQNALSGGRVPLARYETLSPAEALRQLRAAASFEARQLEFTSFAGEPVLLASDAGGQTRIVTAAASGTLVTAPGFEPERIVNLVSQAAGAANIAELRVLARYDRYYLDRDQSLPLPVVAVRLNDPAASRLYISPKSGRVVGRYSNSTAGWVTRWLYHGLHSMNFPWLYNYRPAWDLVVLSLLGLCTWLSVTSVILAGRVLRRKWQRLRPASAGILPSGPTFGGRISKEDLVSEK